MHRTHEVAVVGLGVAGAATAAELARRGTRVVGVDRWQPPHTSGSSHGETRITRAAYFEAPHYVPLVRRATALWRELEASTGRTLLRETGGLTIGPAEGAIVSGALASAREHGVEHELLTAAEIRQRWPGIRPHDGMAGVLEARAGLLFPESCVSALHEAARAAGADLRPGVRVTGWRPAAEAIVLGTTAGTLRARRVVLAAGPWLTRLTDQAELPLAVERQVMAWYPPSIDEYRAERSPLTLWEREDGTLFYTCPDLGAGLKAAVHHGGPIVDPEAVERRVSAEDLAPLQQLVRDFLPALPAEPARTSVCLYTNTPDHEFVIDVLPREPRVAVISACSGHGFKFAPAVAELVADLVLAQARPAGALFSLSRFDRARPEADAAGA